MTNEEADRVWKQFVGKPLPKELIGQPIVVHQKTDLPQWGDKVKVTDVATTIVEYDAIDDSR